MKTYYAESAQRGLSAAANAGLSWQDFAVAAAELLERAISYDAICIGTVDPANKLATNCVKINLDHMDDRRFVEFEYGTPDFNKYADLADRPVAVGILEQATEGDPYLSRRQREYLSGYEIDHELRGAVRDGSQMWGLYAMYRNTGRSGFSPAEADFLHRAERTMALGLRRGLIAASIDQARQAVSAAAVIMFDQADLVTSATPGAEARIAELGGDLWAGLPTPLVSVVAAARAVAAGTSTAVPELRVRSTAGEWLTLYGAPVRDRDGLTSQVAVTIESAGPAKIIPLIVAAYGLTDRERTVVQRVLRGDSTNQIAAALHLSPYTVQDHLKVVFDKMGVTSRRELTSRVFFTEYWSRFESSA